MNTKKPIQSRFNKYVMPEPNSGCWLWFGNLNKSGYGFIKVCGKQILAHRLSYELFVSKIPEGLQVLHRCDVRCCVNPDHLWIGTNYDNVLDKIAKGRMDKRDGSNNGNSKLTKEQVEQIRLSGGTCRELAKIFGVHFSTISQIRKNKTWDFTVQNFSPLTNKTLMTQKEELRRKFDKFMNSAEKLTPSRSRIFDFFYAEIEAREKQLQQKTILIDGYSKQVYELMKECSDIESHYASQGMGLYPKEVYAKLKAQQEIIEAADEVMGRTTWNQGDSYHEAIEKYNQLKTKSQS